MAPGSSDSIRNAGPGKDAVVVADTAVLAPIEALEQQHNTYADYRANFLSTFTPEEETKIMRKIDCRILLISGIIYMVKQVTIPDHFPAKINILT